MKPASFFLLLVAFHSTTAYLYDESCKPSSGYHCNEELGLSCQDFDLIGGWGKCKCSPRFETFFSEEAGRCVGLALALCDPSGSSLVCQPNSHCEDSILDFCRCDVGYVGNAQRRCVLDDGRMGSSCTSNDNCDWNTLRLHCGSAGVCECAEGYHATQNGTCIRDYMSSCNSIDPCDSSGFQRCSSNTIVRGQCQCLSIAMAYNNATKECVSAVGESCGDDPHYPGIDCVENAECQECNDHPDCWVTQTHLCLCNDGYFATLDQKMCRPRGVEIGDACNTTSLPCEEDSYSVCDGDLGVCACPSTMQPNKLGSRCYQRHGEYCLDHPCNADRYLYCSSQACRCRGFDQEFDAERDICVGLATSWCSADQDPVWGVLCTSNATCVVNPDVDRNNMCVCDEGFAQDKELKCVPI